MVTNSGILVKEVTATSLIQLRQLLDSPKLALEYCREFYAHRQLPNKDLCVYVRALRHLAEQGLADESAGDHDERILEQLLEGASSTIVQKEFFLRPPQNLDAVVDQADLLERTDAAICQKEYQSYPEPHSLHVGPWLPVIHSRPRFRGYNYHNR
ncbi:hypothetical protein FGIG_07573 [Fasciola gigantica]|uniref:Uncharacterized protein n=1 Tax=Fasciola gigantica TaxID=46835 RepID=A0A504Z5S7_FASGI|nr:hypothetical protein FGIG_07573 [Fasciola gigantica]